MSPQICGYLLVLVAQCAVNTAPVGAPETIELFHPEMPPAPARSPANKKEAVPVIHLNADENGKASVDAYLKMFPQELLTSNKKVRPIDVRKIEHEDFIDYEIEFVELSEEFDEDEEEAVKLILSETGEHLDDTIKDMLSSSYVNNSDDQTSIKSSNSSSELSEESKEMNLVTFVDLLRRARIRHQSKISSDKRRRRRIKLKRDPVRNIPTDTNDSSNQIDTSQHLKREQNSYSKTNTFSKPRELIRNKSPPETNRNSGNRRITLPRYNSFRGRKRVPIKSGRKLSRGDNPVDQLIKLRNPQKIAKMGRSSTERTTKMTTLTSTDKLFTDSIKKEDTDKSIVVTRNVTSTRLVTPASSFPILTSTTAFFEQTTETNLDDKPANSENLFRTEMYQDMATTGKQRSTKTTIGMVELTSTTTVKTTLASSTTTSTATTRVTISTNQLKTTKSNDKVKSPTLTTTMKPIRSTTGTSMTSTTLMMYPEVFTDHTESQEVKHEFEDPSPIETISLPFSLLSLFGGKPKSSRLEIAPPPTSTFSVIKTYSEQPERETYDGEKAMNDLSHKKNQLTSINQLPQITTVTSASEFSILSTSTQTSNPLYETTTNAKTIDSQLTTEKSSSSSIEPYLAKMMTAKPNVSDGHQSSTERSLFHNKKFSTTISLPPSVLTTETHHSDLSRTTTSPNWTRNSPMTEVKNEYTTNKNNMQNEYKYQEVMTSTKVESITDDNRQVSTPNNTTAALPEDLQLSESITSVYLHNSPTSQTLTNNVGTTENPKMESVNSITLMPYSKLANHMQETRKELTTVQSITENIFTVTPQYLSSTSPNTQKAMKAVKLNEDHFDETKEQVETFNPTTEITDIPLETLYSGQYHEISPGQYQEISPGQYHEENPGQYEEIHPGQYNELHPGQPGQYHNFEKSYSEDYEVNDVKVDFDHQDEHKIYNVQAKAGDFIIGEVGRIDINNGQTLEGVRYTALEGEVDPLRISQILERFFGTRTS